MQYQENNRRNIFYSFFYYTILLFKIKYSENIYFFIASLPALKRFDAV